MGVLVVLAYAARNVLSDGPICGLFRHGSGEPLRDAVDTLRVVYLTGELLYPRGDRAYRGGRIGLMLCTADCFDILLKGACREDGPGSMRWA